ncbi:MAG: hypothetical protein ACLQPH_18885 [Acidimicrobiales bacterium]
MNPESDPIANDRRKARQSRRLPPDAACALCGETEIAVLAQYKVPRRLLELHHVAGQANDDEVVVVLCRNCHAKATAEQQDVGALVPGPQPSCLESMRLAMLSLGTFLQLVAQACFRWAAQLGQTITSLDEHLSSWRTLPGMP